MSDFAIVTTILLLFPVGVATGFFWGRMEERKKQEDMHKTPYVQPRYGQRLHSLN